MRPAVGVLALLAGLAACRLPTTDGPSYAGPKNRCETGCPTGATCADGACLATATDYELTIEATPPTTSAHGPGVTFTIPVEDRKGGERPLELLDVVRVTARVTAAAPIPVILTLERTSVQPGAPSTYEARSAGQDQSRALVVPPGEYQVRLEPEAVADLAKWPPVLLRDDVRKAALAVTLTAGPQLLAVSYGSTFRTFTVTLVDEKDVPVTLPTMAYDVSVVDANTGRLVSSRTSTCTTPGAPLSSEVTLALSPEIDGERRVLRLEPARIPCTAATASALPSFEYDLGALDVEGRGKAKLTLPTLKPVVVTAEVHALGAPSQTLASRVIFTSTTLDVPDGVRAGQPRYVVRADTDAGRLTLALLPGSYTADVVPDPIFNQPARGFSTCQVCKVPSQDPGSKPGDKVSEFKADAGTNLVFELSRRGKLKGRAAGFDGAIFPLGTWEAGAASGDPLRSRSQLGRLALVSQRSTKCDDGTACSAAETCAAGHVCVATVDAWNVDADLDAGLYDLLVRVPEASGYPWLVVPRLSVGAGLDAGVLTMAAPVVMTGVVADPRGVPVPGTRLRARATVLDRTTRAPVGSVIVGETQADANGNYRLIVPATLNPGPSTKS